MSFFICSTANPKTTLEKKLLKIWQSNGKRFIVARFRCNFCGRIKKGSSYSVVDGGKSCQRCDKNYKDDYEQS